MRRFLLPLLLALPACFAELPEDDLGFESSPFANAHYARGQATLTVTLLDGYDCPDGRPARLYTVVPDDRTGPGPGALILHGAAFDYFDALGNSLATESKLVVGWAAAEVERALGLRPAEIVGSPERGAWAAALLEAGYVVAAPTNCFGDLWHGRARNDLSEDGFLRVGAYLADEALAALQAREDTDPASTLVVGLGEGGRGIAELAVGVPGAAARPPFAVALDSSPDWLPPALLEPVFNADTIRGFERIWAGDLYGIEDDQEARAALQRALERDSLVHAVTDLGFRTPIFYAYSSSDERIDDAQTRPAADAIAAAYDPSRYRVVDWATAEHAPSNHDLAQAREQVGWLSGFAPAVP